MVKSKISCDRDSQCNGGTGLFCKKNVVREGGENKRQSKKKKPHTCHQSQTLTDSPVVLQLVTNSDSLHPRVTGASHRFDDFVLMDLNLKHYVQSLF